MWRLLRLTVRSWYGNHRYVLDVVITMTAVLTFAGRVHLRAPACFMRRYVQSCPLAYFPLVARFSVLAFKHIIVYDYRCDEWCVRVRLHKRYRNH